ncbi:MAG: hypothetical protein HOI34_09640 [Rhodospirillaceae bacterium]|nr:hypothetical protein [Rhodospirillaceae bacterium]
MAQLGLDAVDTQRWPINDLASPAGIAMLNTLREELGRDGWCTLPSFLTAAALARLAGEAEALSGRAWPGIDRATPYYGKIDPDLPADLPDDHPRCRTSPRNMAQVAYDQIPGDNALRHLYQSQVMPDFLAAVLEPPPFFPMACPYQVVNISVMNDSGSQNWHFDGAQFSTTLMLQKPEQGGVFECVPQLRSRGDQNYAGVGRVMDGDRSGVVPVEVDARTLMIFRGELSLHRVSPVAGPRKRLLVIFHYDTTPGLMGPHVVNQALYGPRVERQT